MASAVYYAGYTSERYRDRSPTAPSHPILRDVRTSPQGDMGIGPTTITQASFVMLFVLAGMFIAI
jgi:hypothetical protein